MKPRAVAPKRVSGRPATAHPSGATSCPPPGAVRPPPHPIWQVRPAPRGPVVFPISANRLGPLAPLVAQSRRYARRRFYGDPAAAARLFTKQSSAAAERRPNWMINCAMASARSANNGADRRRLSASDAHARASTHGRIACPPIGTAPRPRAVLGPESDNQKAIMCRARVRV